MAKSVFTGDLSVEEASKWRALRDKDSASHTAAINTANVLGVEVATVLHTLKPNTQRGAMHVFNSFFQEGDFDSALAYCPVIFKSFPKLENSPQLTEKRIVAMNKTTPPRLVEAYNLAKKMFELDPSNGEAAGIYGKTLKCLAEKARVDRNPEQARSLMTERANVLLKGFEQSGEFYPGINAAYAFAALGDHKRAQEVAQWCSLSAQASIDTRDWWARVSAVESAVIANDPDMLKKSMSLLAQVENVQDWMRETTVQTLGSLDPAVYPLAKNVQQDIGTNKYLELKGTQPALHPMISKTYSYRNMGVNFSGGQHIEGNLKFGGQLPAHAVSSWDRNEFKKLLALPLDNWLDAGISTKVKNAIGVSSLNECSDPHKVLAALDVIIRNNYDTDGAQVRGYIGLNKDTGGLERLDSREHEVFDTYIKKTNAMWFGDNQRSADSRTSVALNFAMGIGDCRHHAASKQLLFDLWQEKQLATLIQKGLTSSSTGDSIAAVQLVGQYNDLANLRLRTADVEVSSYIAGDTPYVIPRSSKGEPLFSDKKRTVEEHTMNILVKTDSQGAVVDANLCDSFYQKEYQFGAGKLPVLNAFDVQATTISVEKNNSIQQIPVFIKPTVYAGERAKPQLDETGCEGLHMGVPTSTGSLDILQHRKQYGARAVLFDGAVTQNVEAELSFGL